MLHKMYIPLNMLVHPYQVGKDIQRFYSKGKFFSKTLGALLMKQRGAENDFFIQKRNLNDKESCTISKQLTENFPNIVRDIVDDPISTNIPEGLNRFKDTLEHIGTTGNRCASISLVKSYKYMEDAENVTAESIELANILGWCIEMMQAARTTLDKKESVERGIIDVVLLENYIYQVLKKHFSHLPMYVPAMQLLQETFLRLTLGTAVDGMPLEVNIRSTIENCSKKRYQTIVKHKTTSIIFELPYNLARCLSNKNHTEIPQEILEKLGEFHHIQNEFSNLYCDASVRDIEEGKCTWLLLKALEKGNPLERRALGTYYGKKDPESIKIMKDLYNDVGVPKAYAKYEEDAFNFIEKNIELVSNHFCHKLMFKRLDKFYQPYI